MLVNGNLEGGFSDYDGIGELEMAEGWAPWFHEYGDVLHRPEYKPFTEDDWVHSGGYSQKIFTTHVRHHAGMMQLVEVTENEWYRFSAWAKCRTGSSDDYSYLMAVGANPYGTPPTDSFGQYNNVLGRSSWKRNEWQHLTVTFQAFASKVWVFTFGIAKYSATFNDSYWDDLKLKPIAAPEPAPQPEPEPQPEPVPGCGYDEASLLAGVREVVREEIDATVWAPQR